MFGGAGGEEEEEEEEEDEGETSEESLGSVEGGGEGNLYESVYQVHGIDFFEKHNIYLI